MKVLLLNGSPNEKGCTYTALSEVAGELNKHGVETEFIQLGTKPVMGCIACRKCFEEGKCVFDDDPCNALAEKIAQSDGLVVGSPVYFAAPNGALCALLDRAFYSSAARFKHKPAAAIVSCRRGGASAAFDRLNKYFTISQMHVVASTYWNAVHGRTPEDVKRDLEGLQIMRNLGRNMAWLLEQISNGNPPPPPEDTRLITSFADGK